MLKKRFNFEGKKLINMTKIEREEYYEVHKYAGRKNPTVIARLINDYSKVGETVLDPFSGSGTVVVEAIRAKRKGVGIDNSPLSVFISKNTISCIQTGLLKESFKEIEKAVQKKINNLYTYSRKCLNCKGKTNQILNWTVLSKKEASFVCTKCGKKNKVSGVFEKIVGPVLPKIKLPEIEKNVETLNELFTTRNAFSLQLLLNEIKKIDNDDEKSFFLYCFSASIEKSSKLNSFKPISGWRRNKSNAFFVPKDSIEFNVWDSFSNKVEVAIIGKEKSNEFCCGNKLGKIILGTATKIPFGKETVDLIITDPPYGESINYGDLSYLNAYWLELEAPSEEIMGKATDSKFTAKMAEAFTESFRVLKKGKKMILILTNTTDEWLSYFCEIAKNTGFSKPITEIKRHDYGLIKEAVITFEKFH